MTIREKFADQRF